jgi:hypothetical protein
MKTIPFAVAGRCRATAIPAKATCSGTAPDELLAREATSDGRCGRSSVSGWTSIETAVVL